MKDILRFIKAYQGLIISTSILIGCFLGLILAVIPALRGVLDLVASTRALTGEVRELRTKSNLLEGIDEETYRGYLLTLTAAVPPDKSLPSLLSTIDGLGQQVGLSIGDLVLTPGNIATEAAKRQSQEEKKLGSNIMPFTLTVEGNFDQLRQFFANLVTIRRLLSVHGFSAVFRGDGTSRGTLQMETFYLSFPASLGKASQKLIPLKSEEESLLTKIENLPNLASEAVGVGPAPGSVPIKSDPFSPL